MREFRNLEKLIERTAKAVTARLTIMSGAFIFEACNYLKRLRQYFCWGDDATEWKINDSVYLIPQAVAAI